jgi:SAM-dependent methyltransferase
VTVRRDLVRIPDRGVTEETVLFADDFVLDRIPPQTDVLDIGCGMGFFDAKVAPKVRSLTGIDLLPEVIEAAEGMRRHENVLFRLFDAEKLTDFQGEFDVIFSRFCFHHLDMDRAAAGIKDRLKTGGRLIAVDCLEDFWKIRGSLFILADAAGRLGFFRIMMLAPRLMFFFTSKRFRHVRSDIARIRSEGRYHFDDFKEFYLERFPGAKVGMVGVAAYIDWRKT